MRGSQGEKLFLHGGPGMSSAVERLWFGRDLPIRWWDQPAATSFDALVQAATAELASMAAAEPVHLVAHSFGGQIAYALARDCPDLIDRITLLGCAYDPLDGIFRVARHIVAVAPSPPLREAIAAAESELNQASFAAMVAAGASSPAYPSVYFDPKSDAALQRFLMLSRQVDFLDLRTFLGVMGDFLHRPALAPASRYTGKVDLLVGAYDPVLSVESDGAAWGAVFPQLNMATVNTGHMTHLEISPDVWLGES